MRKRNKVSRAASPPPVATGVARSISRCRAPKSLETSFRFLLYLCPAVLYFSYFPVIKLGENETMYFELSLPLIWLVVFDVVAFVMLVMRYRARLFTEIWGSVWWWTFPLFATLSVFWSPNPLRGFLTAGVMWALIIAVVACYKMRDLLDASFWKVFWRWFFGTALAACVWCAVQCILDINGFSQEVTLLCDGCVYQMFGFPHPNGFAIEPQFMGNLLIAPTLVVAFFFLVDNQNNTSQTRVASAHRHGRSALFLGRNLRRVFEVLLLIVFCTTLFLTFSRGAVYACVVGLVFMGGFVIFRTKKAERKKQISKVLATLGIFVVSFLFALNLQGIMAAVAPTSDTYKDGVAKVLNHLSLGIIDIRETEKNDVTGVAEESKALQSGGEVVENSVENSEITGEAVTPVFDGYVEESTDTRVRLATAALSVWRKDFKTVMFGVGLGGAGQALYDNGCSPAPREIVQNEYVSLLLETGLVGVSLFIILIILVAKRVLKAKSVGLVASLLISYGVTWLFFSGLPNALNMVLLPALVYLSTTSPSTGSSES